jgi:F420-non-reducing hydrogenase iron-sulfur subunit
MTRALEVNFQPLIISFCCQWCAYPGADLAGAERLQYPASVRIIKVRCSGMVHPGLVIEALDKGADGVMVCGCHPGDCHYLTGPQQAEKTALAVGLVLEELGIDPVRFKLAHISASEGQRFADLVSEMTEVLTRLGPNPYRSG